jgi:hypothetical protein
MPPVPAGRFKVFEGYRQIKSTVNGGRGIKVYAADKATGDGVIPYPYALIDEPHRHKDLGLYRTWKGKLRKRGAQIVAISTAGEPGTDFEETRDADPRRGDGARVPQRVPSAGGGPSVVMHEFKVPKAEQAKDCGWCGWRIRCRSSPRRTCARSSSRRRSTTARTGCG